MKELSEISAFTKRLKPLLEELRPDGGPCPFVVDEDAAQRVSLAHYSGGRDATYILLSQKRNDGQPPSDVSITIRYASFVEGTMIIYDLVDETMQGKARPFVCSLGQRTSRIYALLPFQIEETTLRVEVSTGERYLEVAFRGAQGETIQASLPFELRLLSADGETLHAEYFATNRIGQFVQNPAVLSRASKAVVRSLLTGHEKSLVL
jgi:hypothetical protein